MTYTSNLSGAQLSGANLRGADLSGADLLRAQLIRADLTGADLTSANLSCAQLIRANLGGADLSGAQLSNANLSNANLSNANLNDANLEGANLSGAQLSGAQLSGAQLSDASDIPVIPNIDAAILAAIRTAIRPKLEHHWCALEMRTWHTCETSHCRAGWAIHLAGEAGTNLEIQLGSSAAGALIYAVSRPGKPVPNFYVSNENAMADIIACAEGNE
jgi:hypothetical protein